jgi:myo-inositol-1(or 4)-monophosphatase
MQSVTLEAKLALAHHAAEEAGKIMMAFYQAADFGIETKSNSNDLVTEADLACDKRIRELLTAAYPEDRVITEETHQEGVPFALESAWIIDPIDGTTNFAHRFPHFAVSIAYVEEGEPVLGIVFDPFKQECFRAIRGGGAFLNDKKLEVSPVKTLETALLATGFSYAIKTESRQEGNLVLHEAFLRRSHGVRRPGAAALDMAYVACGRLDGFWEKKLSPWDVAGAALLITEAGGHVSKMNGERLDLSNRYIDLLASNVSIHQQMLSVIQAEEVR